MNFEQILQSILNWATTSGVRLILALILLLISFKLINFFAKKILTAAA